eukprot:jgi/Mesen1/9694/ME000069S09099
MNIDHFVKGMAAISPNPQGVSHGSRPFNLAHTKVIAQALKPTNSSSHRMSGLSSFPVTSGSSGDAMIATRCPSQSTTGVDLLSPQSSGPTSYADMIISPAGLARVKLSELLPEDGAASGIYTRAVENISLSLARYNAAILQLDAEDAALVRCALDSARLYFKSRAGGPTGSVDWTRSGGYYAAPSKEMYFYRAGRVYSEDEHDMVPPCMPEVFRCLGKASRAALGAAARHLRLRGDSFHGLLDDNPLPIGEISSSVLTATCHHHTAPPGPRRPPGEDTPPPSSETEKGLLMLMAADTPGLQVCDPTGKWYIADHGVGPGDLILLTGRALHQATAGLRRPSTCSLAFRLMPRPQAVLDCTAVASAGHSVPDAFQEAVQVASFMDALNVQDAATSAQQQQLTSGATGAASDAALAAVPKQEVLEPSLRAVLADPLS